MCACVGRCKGAGRGGPSVCACGSHLRCYFSGAIPLGFALFCFEMRSLTGLEFTKQAGLAGWVESSRERPVLASPVLRSQAHATMLGFFSPHRFSGSKAGPLACKQELHQLCDPQPPPVRPEVLMDTFI